MMARCMMPKEMISVCRKDAGFTTLINDCGGAVEARIHRSGAAWAEDLMFTVYAVEQDGKEYTFVMPSSFWGMNIGYYDADIFSGNQFVKTVRLALGVGDYGVRGKSEAVESESDCVERPDPNTAPVVTCEEEPCAPPEPCALGYTYDPYCGEYGMPDNTTELKTLINTADVVTNEDVINYIDDLIDSLDSILELGFYYNQSIPVDAELRESVTALKERLLSLQDANTPETTDAVVMLRAELAALKSQIDGDMAAAAKIATRPVALPTKPLQTPRIVKTKTQELADKFEAAARQREQELVEEENDGED